MLPMRYCLSGKSRTSAEPGVSEVGVVMISTEESILGVVVALRCSRDVNTAFRKDTNGAVDEEICCFLTNNVALGIFISPLRTSSGVAREVAFGIESFPHPP